MGRKKDKLIKRIVVFYKSVFKFDPPIKILVDGNFISLSMRKKLDLKVNLNKVLDENIHLIITSCVLKEIKEIEKFSPGLLNYTLKYKVDECQHNFTPEECIKFHIGKKNHKKYFVATQDPTLRKALRFIPGVPIVYFDQNIVMIEKPSFASNEAYDKRENLKMQPTKDEKTTLSTERILANNFMKQEYMKSAHFKNKMATMKILRMNGRLKKKAKGPNPLSCLKKQREKGEVKRVETADVIEENRDNIENTNNIINHNEGNTLNINDSNIETVRNKRKRNRKKNK